MYAQLIDFFTGFSMPDLFEVVRRFASISRVISWED